MKLKAYIGWYVFFPVALWSERWYAHHRGYGYLRGYLECGHWVCRLGRWADQIAHILGEVNYGSWWV